MIYAAIFAIPVAAFAVRDAIRHLTARKPHPAHRRIGAH